MAIKDIQKSEPRLPRLGIIRLGIKMQNPNGKEYPADVDHFVMTNAPDLIPAYGEKPTSLQIYLPFATIDENIRAWHELWKASGCVCRGDGERIVDLMGPDGHKVIREGVVIRDYSERDDGAYLPNGDSYQKGDIVRCPGLEHDLYPRCADCKPSAILIAMVRDPQRPTQVVGDRLGYYQIRTHSFYNIQNLDGQLKYAAQLAERMGRTLQGIPMVLRRVKRELPYTDDKTGQRKTTTKHLLELEFDPQWVQWANAGMHSLAVGEVIDVPALPAPIEHVSGELVDEPVDVTPTQAEPQPEPEPATEQIDAPRPWSPQMLVSKLDVGVERHLEKHSDHAALIDEDAGRKIARQIGNTLNGIVHTDERRHQLLQFLFDVESSFYLSIARRDVLESWLTKDRPMAREEAELVMDWITNQPEQAEPEAEAA